MKGFRRHIAASIAITSVFLVCAIAIAMGAAPAKVIDETSKPQVAEAASAIISVEQPVESATTESEAAPPAQAAVDSKPAAAVSNPVAVTPIPVLPVPQPEAAPAPDPELEVTPAVAPNPPINLTGTYMTKVPPYVRLTWTAPTGGSKVNHYHIYRTIVGGPVPMATTPLAETKNRNYNDYAIADYTLYRYWVTAVNSAGEESSSSNIVDVQTSSTAVCAPPQGVAAYVVDPGISIDWLPNTEKNLAGYNVYELRNNQWRKLNSTLLTDNHYYYASGVSGRQYGVTAVNTFGIESSRTSVTPTVPPNPPINLVGTYMTKVPPYVRLTWTAPTGGSKVDHYHIYRTIVGGPVPMATTPLAETTSRNYNDDAIADYTLYRYWVTAVNSAGEESSPSNTVDVQTYSTKPCSPPQGVAAYVVDPGISIDWLPNTEKNLAGYNVYELRNNQWRKLNSSLLTDNHYYYASGIATRQYAVTAVNKSGIESTRTSVTPQATTPVIYEENNPSITVTGLWMIESYTGPTNGKIRVAGNAGARLNFPFSGSQVKLIVAKYWTCGNARIYLDGSLYSTVSVYSYNTIYKVTAVSIPGVKRGSHTISVEVVGSGNPETTTYNFVNVDCFEVR